MKQEIQALSKSAQFASTILIRGAETLLCAIWFFVLGLTASHFELWVLAINIMQVFATLSQMVPPSPGSIAFAINLTLCLSACSLVTYWIGRFHVEAFSAFVEPERRRLFANLLVLSALVGWLPIVLPTMSIEAIPYAIPFALYFLGCLMGLKAVIAGSRPKPTSLPISHGSIDDVLNSRNLVELNSNARAAVIALGKKCPDGEQAVTVLLDNLVKAKRMNDAEQISAQYLKFIEQYSTEKQL